MLILHTKKTKFVLTAPPEAYQATGDTCPECHDPVLSSAEYWDRRISCAHCRCTMRLTRYTPEMEAEVDTAAEMLFQSGGTVAQMDKEIDAAVKKLVQVGTESSSDSETEMKWPELVKEIREKQANHARKLRFN
jgi:hypothetical protein